MNQPVSASSRARDDYRLGLLFFRKRQWRSAARHFGLAQSRSSRNDEFVNLYTSYHGLALIRCGDVSGLNLCRHAAAREQGRAEVFVNLVLAELRFRHRRRAWEALSRGFQIDSGNPALHKLARKMGVRRRPLVPFLKREHPLNKWIGKATYRRPRRAGKA
ncbi:MAG TPA: hypothetical protein ENK12_12355 [Gammaproteobacteria bacterium]|nr:hypothetical protein [Gammaproteobacteria bacterium]